MKASADPAKVFRDFTGKGGLLSIIPIATGLINASYKVKPENDSRSYLLQRVNSSVFPDVPGMMNNILLVTEQLKSDAHYRKDYRIMDVLKSQSDNPFEKDEGGNYWRLSVFYDDLLSYDTSSDEKMIYRAGEAFARFSNALCSMDIQQISETIPDFHLLQKRIMSFEKTIRSGFSKKEGQASDEIQFINLHKNHFIEVEKSLLKLPKTITHNDSKVNNLLFDRKLKAQCVIDLDTVMPGYLFYDLGDLIRTTASMSAEDENNTENIAIARENLTGAIEGYLQGCNHDIFHREKHLLIYCGSFFAFLMGVRFLTDYLQDDIYYSTKYENHNLVRARAQFKLCAELMANEDFIASILRPA